MTYKKKLIEVSLPLDVINDASAYDKMPGIGPHPKGIHQWWARLPLPTARAILFASVVTDPSDDPRFKNYSEEELQQEREKLHDIVRRLLQKKAHTNPAIFEEARKVMVEHTGGELPAVLDPFCGGGSIPLEAQRLGFKALGSDLNPVAVLITKAMIEIPPKFANRPPVNREDNEKKLPGMGWAGAKGLAADVRHYGEWMRKEAEKKIGHLYPKVKLPKEQGGNEATVIAWIWARTVKCPNPGCGAEMPLVRSFDLSTKKGKEASIKVAIKRNCKVAEYVTQAGKSVDATGTVTRQGATCLFCESPVAFDHIRSEGRVGRLSYHLMAVVAEGRRGRLYLSPSDEHIAAAQQAKPKNVPETDLPPQALGFRVQQYGMTKHRDLFTPRQLVALTTFSDLVGKAREKVLADAKNAGMPDDGKGIEEGGTGAMAYADAVATYLGMTVDRLADFNNAICRWVPSNEKTMNLFGRQAIPMTWDYAEANVLAESVGGWLTCHEYVAECIEQTLGLAGAAGEVRQLDATKLTGQSISTVISTDPPYYDNIGYADLSDFFYVWLRRSLCKVYPVLFSTMLTPKREELIATPYRFEGSADAAKEHFEGGFHRAFTNFQRITAPEYPLTVYYAFKQSEDTETESSTSVVTGWETMLQGLLSSGYQITATWPVRASQQWRMVSMGTNALASYIVLSCRPRPERAVLTSRREFVKNLRSELPEALKHLRETSIAPVDLAQAAIGPGMAVFSSYSKVVEADGNPMSIRTALALINQTLDEIMAEQESEFDADTRFALAWFEQNASEPGDYGVAELLSKSKVTSIEGLVQAGILYSRAGKVRLLKRSELSSDWDPSKDKRWAVWKVMQHLIKAHDEGGQPKAADILRKVGALGETARDLAYRVFTICERKGWAQEALAYNGLVVAWPEIQRLAKGAPQAGPGEQLKTGI